MTRKGFLVAVLAALAVHVWNALFGPVMYGYDDWGHVAYVLFLDLYGSLPWADQGWSYFHPPLHYLLGWTLAQAGSSEVLLRGLALLGGASSLAIAAMAAWVARVASPERPALALAAFCAVAFLPVHLYAAPMSGNEMTSALLASATLVSLVAGERRAVPTLRGDAWTGLFAGLALLAKFSGALAFGSAALVIAGRRRAPGGPGRAARLAVFAAVALAIAGPWYARNLLEYGTPLRLSRADPLVAEVEAAQPPGERGWLDFVKVSPHLFVEPDPRAPHLLHSVWGTLYTNVWVDTRSPWSDASALRGLRIRRADVTRVWLGLVPTGLALVGAGLFVRDLRRGQRVPVALPLVVSAGATLASFVAFAVAVPTFAALKASYLLGASVGFGACLARGLEGVAHRSRPGAVAAALACVAAWGAAAAIGSAGLVLPKLPESQLVGPVRLYFGELDRARALYQKLLFASRANASTWSENLAAVELVAGDAGRALAVLERRGVKEGDDVWHDNQLGVAHALAGDPASARALFDRAAMQGGGAVALANRGALLAREGETTAAIEDLKAALSLDPALAPAQRTLAQIAPAAAEGAASPVPRGFPYGLGGGLGQRADPRVGRRWLLLFEGGGLRLAHAPAADGW